MPVLDLVDQIGDNKGDDTFHHHFAGNKDRRQDGWLFVFPDTFRQSLNHKNPSFPKKLSPLPNKAGYGLAKAKNRPAGQNRPAVPGSCFPSSAPGTEAEKDVKEIC